MLKEFRDFAARGNVIDLAVGVIIGAAFGKVVTSVVNDLIMPPIGMALGRVDFTQPVRALERRLVSIGRGREGAGAPTINYGIFLNTCPRIPDRRVCRFSSREAGQPVQGPRPVVVDSRDCPFCLSQDSAQGDAVLRVHVRGQAGGMSREETRGS